MKSIFLSSLCIYLLISFGTSEAQKNTKKDYYNSDFYNLLLDGVIYEKVSLKNNFWQTLGSDTDTNSVQFAEDFLERTGEKYIPGQSVIPYYFYEQSANIKTIIEGDLNSDKNNEVVILFEHGFPGSSSNSIFIFDIKNHKLESIGAITLGSRGLGGIAEKSDECPKCKGMEIKDGKLNVFVYDGTYAVDFSTYKIESYKLEKNGLKKVKTSKKYTI